MFVYIASSHRCEIYVTQFSIPEIPDSRRAKNRLKNEGGEAVSRGHPPHPYHSPRVKLACARALNHRIPSENDSTEAWSSSIARRRKYPKLFVKREPRKHR